MGEQYAELPFIQNNPDFVSVNVEGYKKSFLAIKSNYINSIKKMPNSFVYIRACHSYDNGNFKDNFFNKNVKCYIGWQGTLPGNFGHEFANEFINKILYGESTKNSFGEIDDNKKMKWTSFWGYTKVRISGDMSIPPDDGNNTPSPVPTGTSTPDNNDAVFLQYPWGTGDSAPEFNYITKSPGEEFWIDFKSYNTGSTTWKKGTYYFHNDIQEKGFGNYDRHYMIDSDVSPGGTWGYKRFNLKAPTTPGTYYITCRMGKETNSEFGGYINWVVTVKGSTTQTDDAKFLQYPWGTGDTAPEFNYITKSPCEEFWIDFKSYNTGSTTWKKGTYYFHNDIQEKGFGNYDRHYMIDSDVSPGGTWGYKRFNLKAPTTPGTYYITCRMGKETNSEFGGYINWVVTVKGSTTQTDDAKFLQYPWGTGDIAPEYSYMTKAPGEEFWIDFKSYNTGTTTWKKGTYYFHNDIQEKGFGNYDRHYMIDGDVSPGGTWGWKRFNLKAPTTPGTYYITCRMGKDPYTEFGSYINWVITVQGSGSDYHCEFVTQNSYPTLKEGQSYKFVVKYKNTGNTPWTKSTVYLGTSHPKDRVPGFIREDVVNHNPSGWTAPNRIIMKEDTVYKGGTGTFEFYMSVPNSMEHKAYDEYFQLVTNGNTWMEDLGMFWRVTVTN